MTYDEESYVLDTLEELLDTKVDKVESKSLINSDFADNKYYTKNPVRKINGICYYADTFFMLNYRKIFCDIRYYTYLCSA